MSHHVHRIIFQKVADGLGILKPDDWYRVSRSQLLNADCSIRTLLTRYYEDSHIKALCNLFPELSLKPWLFPAVHRGFWNDIQNQRLFFDNFARENGFTSREDWYHVTANQIKRAGGASLINMQKGSVPAIMKAFPEYDWKVWKFHSVSSSYWLDENNVKSFFDSTAKDLNFVERDDWYKFSIDLLNRNGGSGILTAHGNSIYSIFKKIYPDTNWKIWKFNDSVPKDYWNVHEHQLDFFKDFSKVYDYQKPEDWYKVKKIDIEEHGGSWIFDKYGSMRKALERIYPTFDWKPWRFLSTTRGFYDDLSRVQEVIEDLGKGKSYVEIDLMLPELHIQQMEDWYQVTYNQLSNSTLGHKVLSIVNKHGGLVPLLMRIYPKYSWEIPTVNTTTKSQNHLFRCVQELLPGEDVHFNFPHRNLRFETSGHQMELDVFVPRLNLAFEYQGEQHYAFTKSSSSSSSRNTGDHFYSNKISRAEKNDFEKRETCKKHRITLIEIPYWWDHSKKSLIASIQRIRPDVILVLDT